MKLTIEPNNGVPIYEQLVRQIKYAVAEGVAAPGQVIPSVRDMARTQAINPNTVQRAYLQLQDEQIIHALRGRGMAVSEGAKERCIDYRKQILADRMKAVVAEALGGGLGEEQLRALFEQVVAESSKR